MVQDGILRSWSLLKEPPCRFGETRLAIERESLPAEAIAGSVFEEEAFGRGRVFAWDRGFVEIREAAAAFMLLVFHGERIRGAYQLRRMIWYPGNRWLLKKVRLPEGPGVSG